MKKRSLLTAVVMLVVSAILLTSSTYAWFAASHTATVNKVAASISASDVGNVLVRAGTSGNAWTTELQASALSGDGTATLTAIDYNPTSSKTAAYVADYDGLNYTVSAGDVGNVLTYTWSVKALNVPTTGTYNISIPVSFDAGGSYPCIHGAIAINSGSITKVYGSNAYTTVGGVTAATDDDSGTAGIIDTADTKTGSLGASVSAGGLTDTILIENVSSDTVYTVTCYVWAEGQDPDCTGSIAVTGAGFEFSNISLVAAI